MHPVYDWNLVTKIIFDKSIGCIAAKDRWLFCNRVDKNLKSFSEHNVRLLNDNEKIRSINYNLSGVLAKVRMERDQANAALVHWKTNKTEIEKIQKNNYDDPETKKDRGDHKPRKNQPPTDWLKSEY